MRATRTLVTACLATLAFAAPAAGDPVVDQFEVGAGPTQIAQGPDGRMWFPQYNGSVGGQLGRVATSTGSYVPLSLSPGTGPYGVSQTADNHSWVTERGTSAGVILCITPTPKDTVHDSVA